MNKKEREKRNGRQVSVMMLTMKKTTRKTVRELVLRVPAVVAAVGFGSMVGTL